MRGFCGLKYLTFTTLGRHSALSSLSPEASFTTLSIDDSAISLQTQLLAQRI